MGLLLIGPTCMREFYFLVERYKAEGPVQARINKSQRAIFPLNATSQYTLLWQDATEEDDSTETPQRIHET